MNCFLCLYFCYNPALLFTSDSCIDLVLLIQKFHLKATRNTTLNQSTSASCCNAIMKKIQCNYINNKYFSLMFKTNHTHFFFKYIGSFLNFKTVLIYNNFVTIIIFFKASANYDQQQSNSNPKQLQSTRHATKN